MKRLITVLIIFAAISLQAQRTIQKDVGDFNELKVFDLIEVNLIHSDENKVVIKGKNTESVKVINKNGLLKLRMSLNERFDGAQTFIEVYFTSLDVIDANEGVYIVSNTTIIQNTIELRSQEGGRIKVGLKVNHVKIKAVTGGIVAASGEAISQEVSLNTGGIYEGRELQTNDTVIGITAAGEAEVYARIKVKARVTAGGDVTIYGNPERVDKKQIAGGRIKVMY